MNYSDYDLFISYPSVWLTEILISLFITVFAYGAGPVLLWKTRQTPITSKAVRIFCTAYTVVVAILFIAVKTALGGAGAASSPALLWGVVFYRVALGKLKGRGLLIDQAVKGEAAPVMEQMKGEAPVVARSQARQEQQKAPRVDRRSGSPLILVPFLSLILCLGGLSAYTLHQNAVLKQELDAAHAAMDATKDRPSDISMVMVLEGAQAYIDALEETFVHDFADEYAVVREKRELKDTLEYVCGEKCQDLNDFVDAALPDVPDNILPPDKRIILPKIFGLG